MEPAKVGENAAEKQTEDATKLENASGQKPEDLADKKPEIQPDKKPGNEPVIGKAAELARKKRTFKIIVIGDTGVGKTCLTYRFCSGKFPSTNTEATIGVDFREKIITIDNAEQVRLQLWDTAGQERFRRSMVAHYYRNVSAVVLVYDVTRPETFKGLAHWIEECDKHGIQPTEVPMLIVGNKCDSDNSENMAVDTTEAQKFADSKSMPLFETSAKDDEKCDHVEAIFLTLAHKINAKKTLFKKAENTIKVAEKPAIDDSEEEEDSCCF